MTRRQDLDHQRRSLREVRGIMHSMKTLAYMETRRLGSFLEAQRTVVESIESAAADLLAYHAYSLLETGETTPVYLAIGTERGFCGDFNRKVERHLNAVLEAQPDRQSLVIAVGHKMHSLLENDRRISTFIAGASVAEEVTAVLNQVVAKLFSLQTQYGLLTVYGLYHDFHSEVALQQLLPPFQQYLQQVPQFPHPPLLHLPPADLFAALVEHYLFGALHAMLYSSLMAENQSRMMHLEGAVKRLDDDSEALDRQYRALRQEEIIEEIEVILLNASSVEGR